MTCMMLPESVACSVAVASIIDLHTPDGMSFQLVV